MVTATEGQLRVKVPFEPFERAFRKAPVAAYYWMRIVFDQVLRDHRGAWLKNKRVKFGGRKSGIFVTKVNETGAQPFRTVNYRLRPKEVRRADAPLSQIRGEVFTNSEALEAHELGTTIRPKRGKYVAIPITLQGQKRTKLTPRKFRKRLRKSSALIIITAKDGRLFLAERSRRRTGTRTRLLKTKTGTIRKSQKKTLVDTITPRWRLKPKVQMKETLEFFDTWDGGASVRRTILARNGTRLLKDIASGVRT